MRKNRNDLNEILDTMVEVLGVERVLYEMVGVQDSSELHANLEYISDMWNLDLFKDGE